MEISVDQQSDQGGWSQLTYQRSGGKEGHDHLTRTAEVAFGLFKGRGVERVLIGAPEELKADLKARLHPYIKERIAGKLQADVENASLDDVREAAREAIAEHTRKSEREALDRLNAGVGRGGRGAAGVAEVLDALNQARVETLLIAENFSAAGRVDFEAGLLLPEGADAGEPVEDIVEPAIEKAIEQSATAMVVRHHDDLVPLGGIGAVLRF